MPGHMREQLLQRFSHQLTRLALAQATWLQHDITSVTKQHIEQAGPFHLRPIQLQAGPFNLRLVAAWPCQGLSRANSPSLNEQHVCIGKVG